MTRCKSVLKLLGTLQLIWLITGLNLFFSAVSFAAPSLTLVNNRWSAISLPASSPSGNSVNQVFGNHLPAATYGSDGEWVIYTFNYSNNVYDRLALTSELTPGTGYWIIQKSGADVDVVLAADVEPFSTAVSNACPSEFGCVEVNLGAGATSPVWLQLGYPGLQPQAFSNTTVRTPNGACQDGCTPDQAQQNSVLHNEMYRFDGERYQIVDSSTQLQPWDGYWALKLAETDIQSATWLVPAADDVDESDNARDAARLLTQSSFGTTTSSLAAVQAAGGSAAWIDSQLSLPPTFHVPLIHDIADDGWGDQTDRYQVFWEQALRADDQLRQRVAFALSEIMVISDIPDALINHGNLVGDYYDLLIEHAFGNYRNLLEAITLSPAMGIYLSMLGNDKPDIMSGRRADENYAREVMQLFSIGLEQLNLDGTVKLDASGNTIPTYTQTDVQNLANVFTGWSWDGPQWEVSPVAGWYPDLSRMERPMKSFPAHHDDGIKQVLGNTIPAGQSATKDLADAIDILFNHPNVAPFISRQLIQRLVTSNPEPAYISRVAAKFNNNGAGIRGDLAAVIKAILLDEQARSPDIAEGDNYGKLREPVLRLSQLWRAFNVSNPIPMGFWKTELSQHAPLTANSVFNFYSPDFSPPGELANAGLVAPEFQINSEIALNRMNGAMMWVTQLDSFFGVFPTELQLDLEETLYTDPPALIDHLDLLLTSGSLSVAMKELLIDYISANTEIAGRDRVLRDVLALIVTSADFAIQR